MTNAIPAVKASRVQSIDILRGLVMVLMALDHVRDFFHAEAFHFEPTDIPQTTPVLFFTRFITHFCAPVFVTLAGTSAYLVGLRKGKKALSRFLFTRGLWLIIVEIVLISFGWTFDPGYHAITFQVIWAIGFGMVILSLLIHLPYKLIFAIGIILVFGHNLLDYPEASLTGSAGFWWDLSHHGRWTPYSFMPGHFVVIGYAFIPWTGILTMGYCLGKLFAPEVESALRVKRLTILGISLILLFIILRMINHYGDPSHWLEQKDGVYTFLSFLNISKYPPSLMYTCVTLGPAMLVLAGLEHVQNRLAGILIVFGRVPFFYYILHLYLIHIVCMIAFFVSGYNSSQIDSGTPFLFRPADFGYPLWVVYIIWLLIVATLYPACKWYDGYKRTHRQWWLSYI